MTYMIFHIPAKSQDEGRGQEYMHDVNGSPQQSLIWKNLIVVEVGELPQVQNVKKNYKHKMAAESKNVSDDIKKTISQ